MCDRIVARLLSVTLLIGASLVHDSAAQTGPAANGAVELPVDPADAIETQTDALTAGAGNELKPLPIQHDLPEYMLITQETVKPDFKPAANETKPLGRPKAQLEQNAPVTAGSAKSEPSFFQKFNSDQSGNVRVVGALALVIGLLVLLRTVIRRMAGGIAGGSRPSGVLEILAKYPIGRGQHLLLLKIARRVVLLHQSGSAVSALSEMTDENEVANLLSRMEAGARNSDAARFRKTLQEFSQPEVAVAKGGQKKRTLPMGDAELIDLTRRQRRGLLSFFARGNAT